MKRPRRKRSSDFNAKVALTAIKGDQTLAQPRERFDAHPQQITQWKAQLLEHVAQVFATGASAAGRRRLAPGAGRWRARRRTSRSR